MPTGGTGYPCEKESCGQGKTRKNERPLTSLRAICTIAVTEGYYRANDIRVDEGALAQLPKIAIKFSDTVPVVRH